ncbi:heat shock 70 kDa protein 12B-like [Dreissena polymorpha]|uniref:Uncharacterized protein n=1 Tax=Dreissena polymorpha TaxID=45954 RepID=A0A9D4JVE7_DREPO|nr:heat shock 70 kDa protein 12B-like [Dreissena polymorpha]KAH3825516.1 hypothetical protein DPMN_127393 [Dreissena polymorpha]
MLRAGLQWVNGYMHWLAGRKATKNSGIVQTTSNSPIVQSNSNSLLVAAIDFGTTYSGWAFSFKNDFKSDPTKICVKKWHEGVLTSLKCPTCVLIQSDGETLDTFGFDAETKYSELCETGEHKKWYYFHRFKMMLWNKRIHEYTMLDDESGKSLPARTVFSLSIRFMMDDLIKMSQQQVIGLDAGDIHWVLTVPAIWDDSAKQFMRLAAQEAGIATEKLTIALEPEVASIYCRHLPLQKEGDSDIASFRTGTKYLILDAGGGTIDITVHEVCLGGELKEVHKATGGAWGGTVVDQAFMDFLGQLIGKDKLDNFKKDQMEDYLDLMRDFEVKKRATDLTTDRKVTLRLAIELLEVLEANNRQIMTQFMQTFKHASKIALVSGKLRLNFEIFRSFFVDAVDNILQHLSSLLLKPETSGVGTILMVGGFSESPLLQEAIQNKFPAMKIIVPQEAGLAVLKGAVIFGHCPTSIKSRVSKYTYGTDCTVPFDETHHPLEKRILCDSGYRCDDIFDVLVRAGQTLVVGEKQHAAEYDNSSVYQSGIEFNMFYTAKTDVKFITDDGCKKVGSFNVPISGTGLGRSVIVRVMFGGTELEIECEEKSTGRITKGKINFLQ